MYPSNGLQDGDHDIQVTNAGQSQTTDIGVSHCSLLHAKRSPGPVVLDWVGDEEIFPIVYVAGLCSSLP